MRICKRMILAVTVASIPLSAVAQAGVASFDIEPLPVVDALNKFSAQSNLQILCDFGTYNRVTIAQISGEYTSEEAIARLLTGTELKHEFVNQRTIRVSNQDPRETMSLSRARGGYLQLAQASATAKSPSSPPVQNARGLREDEELETVLVSAQRRDERLQDVPISITVLGGDMLDKSTAIGLSEAISRVPGAAVNVTYQGGGSQIAIRGITASGALFNGSSPISYYLDSVPFGLVRQAIAPDVNSYDLQRVEVLRGPQGTLYGASAQNGVVRVITADADVNKVSLKSRVSGSSTKDGGVGSRGDFAANLPLVDGKLAVRAVAGYQDLAGWIDRPNKKDANDGEIRNMRLKVQAEPVENLSVGLTAWASRSDFGGGSIADDNGRHYSLYDEPNTTDFDVYSLKAAYALPRVTMSAVSSYLEYANGVILDVSALAPNVLARTALDSKVLSQEITFSSTRDDAWRWSAGGIYRDAEDRQYQENRLDGARLGAGALDQTYISRSFAVYGELTRLLLEGRLELTGGLRYFEDEVTGREDDRLTGASPDGLVRSKDKFDAVSPRAVVTWHAGDSATVYASYAEGFRSGLGQSGSLLAVSSQFPPLESDTLKNYELGTKGTVGNRILQYEISVYYIDWQDVQQSLTLPISGATALAVALVNGESASGVGVDLGLTTRPTDGLELGISFSWNDVAMDADVFSFVTPIAPILLFSAGDRLNISAESTINAFGDYAFDLGGGGYTGALSTSVNYTSAMDLRTIAEGQQRIAKGDSMLISRASFEVISPKGWTAMLFVDNIGNEDGSPVKFPFASAITDWNAQVRPRTLGLQLEYVFR